MVFESTNELRGFIHRTGHHGFLFLDEKTFEKLGKEMVARFGEVMGVREKKVGYRYFTCAGIRVRPEQKSQATWSFNGQELEISLG